MGESPAKPTLTEDEWRTVAALRTVPPGPVYEAAAEAIEYVIADRLGDPVRAVHLDQDMAQRIDDAVRAGAFPTRGHYITAAVTAFLADRPSEPGEPGEPGESGPIVVRPTTDLARFARDFLYRFSPGDRLALRFLDEGQIGTVELPAAVATVLRELARCIDAGDAVTIAPVPSTAAGPAGSPAARRSARGPAV